MRIRFYSKQGKYFDEFVSKNEFVNLGDKCLLHNVLYEILDVIPFIEERDCNNQEYIRVIAKRISHPRN